MISDRFRRENGSILVIAVVLSFVTVMLGVTFLTMSFSLHRSVSREVALRQVYYDSQAGAMRGLADLLLDRQINGAMTSFYDDNWMGYRLGGEYGQDIDIGTLHQIMINGIGRSEYEQMGLDKNISLNFAWETYADYLYISHKERDTSRHEIIRFWSPDTLDGRVHSNDTIHVMGSPVFKKRVTTSADYIDPPNTGIFEEDWGYRTPIDFPDQATELRRVAGWSDGTSSSDSLIQIGLSGNRIYHRRCGVRNVNGEDKIHCMPAAMGESSFPIPPSGVIFIYGKTWVSASRGLVDMMDGEYPDSSFTDGNFRSLGFSGQLTIGSSDTMIIVDNLVYQHSKADFSVPTTMDSCSDILGLVSENFIMVGKNVRNTIYINAALAAVRGSISVQDIYWYWDPGWNNEKQSLQIFGSLAQRNRGIVHTQYPGYHLRGFIEKDYRYDVRLQDNPPPHFMRTAAVKMSFLEDLFDGDEGGG
jgi:hypothetical protein